MSENSEPRMEAQFISNFVAKAESLKQTYPTKIAKMEKEANDAFSKVKQELDPMVKDLKFVGEYANSKLKQELDKIKNLTGEIDGLKRSIRSLSNRLSAAGF
jgi:peptidoglycan hydrolase CwlO-like protein